MPHFPSASPMLPPSTFPELPQGPFLLPSATCLCSKRADSQAPLMQVSPWGGGTCSRGGPQVETPPHTRFQGCVFIFASEAPTAWLEAQQTLRTWPKSGTNVQIREAHVPASRSGTSGACRGPGREKTSPPSVPTGGAANTVRTLSSKKRGARCRTWACAR